jgi:ubiquinol-cytochrome c reductase cytochrome c subunit
MRIALALTLTVALATAPVFAQEAPKGSADTGKQTYTAVGCYQCHGYVGQGSVATGGPRLAPRPMPYQAFATYVREPSGEMPPYGAKILSDQEMADIYAYMQAVAPPPARNTITLLND